METQMMKEVYKRSQAWAESILALGATIAEVGGKEGLEARAYGDFGKDNIKAVFLNAAVKQAFNKQWSQESQLTNTLEQFHTLVKSFYSEKNQDVFIPPALNLERRLCSDGRRNLAENTVDFVDQIGKAMLLLKNPPSASPGIFDTVSETLTDLGSSVKAYRPDLLDKHLQRCLEALPKDGA